MSTFGSSIFVNAISECFGRHVRYGHRRKFGKPNEAKVIVKPTPVNIGGRIQLDRLFLNRTKARIIVNQKQFKFGWYILALTIRMGSESVDTK
jgi:hypothetical protein